MIKFSRNWPETKHLSFFFDSPVQLDSFIVSPATYFNWFKCNNPAYHKLLLDSHSTVMSVWIGSPIGMSFWNSKIKHTLTEPMKIVPNWDDLAYKIMLKAIRAKYKASPILLDALLKTGKEELHELDKPDYWSTTEIKPQRFAKILMKVRKENQPC